MRFSFKIAPGIRIRASSRGIRTSIGPRAARLHFGGGGGTGVSTGAGPVSLYGNLGSQRRTRRSSATNATTIAARQRQLAVATKAAEAQQLIAAFQAILNLHQVQPEPVGPPTAPKPAPVNEAVRRRRHTKPATDGISIV